MCAAKKVIYLRTFHRVLIMFWQIIFLFYFSIVFCFFCLCISFLISSRKVLSDFQILLETEKKEYEHVHNAWCKI